MRASIAKLTDLGNVLVIVDQDATIGALPVAIARAARSIPHTLRSVESTMKPWPNSLCAARSTMTSPDKSQPSNEIRGLFTHVHPALEQALGPHLDHPAVADLRTGAAGIVLPKLAE
ncbi:hypothetical protein H9639_05995 [Arthrobacter sp. Sa2CUA1]|uniref:Uncharacterized protein n=1 Tax=Arthrobacter gallicola TaxID=2762225 RepID=A0ABR8UQQ1_9MICC|nr:hypothetical protein [Arthrobacter gallicola]